MTDNEIIKALECCIRPAGQQSCFDCPLVKMQGCCSTFLIQNALDLINRQKAEIEELKNAGDNKTKEILRHISAIEELHEKIKIAKSEAIKEFAERLKEKVINYKFKNAVDGGFIDDLLSENTVVEIIDKLVKEITEVSE